MKTTLRVTTVQEINAKHNLLVENKITPAEMSLFLHKFMFSNLSVCLTTTRRRADELREAMGYEFNWHVYPAPIIADKFRQLYYLTLVKGDLSVLVSSGCSQFNYDDISHPTDVITQDTLPAVEPKIAFIQPSE